MGRRVQRERWCVRHAGESAVSTCLIALEIDMHRECGALGQAVRRVGADTGVRRSCRLAPLLDARPRELVEFGGGELELGGGHLERGEQLAASSPLWPGGMRKPVGGGGDAPDRRRPNSTARLPTKAPRWLAKWISPKAPLKALELLVATGLSLQTKRQDQCHRRSGSSASSLRNRPNVQRLPCAGRCPPSMRHDQFAVKARALQRAVGGARQRRL